MPQISPSRFRPEALTRGFKDRVLEWDASLRGWAGEVTRRIKDLPQTNYELGVDFARRGEVRDAIFRFRLALYFAPNFTAAWYNLGCCQRAAGDMARAKESLRKALALDPSHADAKYMLATIDPALLPPQDRPQHMPAHLVTGAFARQAAEYETLELLRGYEGHVNLYKKLRPTLATGAIRILDLGCGTGFAALPWRREALTITGVDVTPEMARMARAAKTEGAALFEQVQIADVNSPHFSLNGAETFPLVLALHLLPWLGEASAFVAHGARLTAPGGVLAFTYDPYTGPGGFGVLPATTHFGHSAEYLRGLLEAAGMSLLSQDTIALYPDVKHPLMIAMKRTAA